MAETGIIKPYSLIDEMRSKIRFPDQKESNVGKPMNFGKSIINNLWRQNMLIRHTLLAAAVFTTVLAGCNKRDEAPATPPAATSPAEPSPPPASPAAPAAPAAPSAAPPTDTPPAPAAGDSGEKK
ncbi:MULTISPECIES: hypothetical protein [unclassified Herbaspirillum]|uniref:hypothetical protein n=1 Tax=unclassified Herbaspirillum TaxID=2624150 RepID=UPI00179E0B02|nr:MULTISPECIES: hypothetical protein [unclassified Herbaspirillum]MBB5390924.1 hypothetical protein [Herbaspirillum sp. SJZ102]